MQQPMELMAICGQYNGNLMIDYNKKYQNYVQP